MSETESKFIRQLKITLISVLTPFIIVGTINAISDHHRIQNNQRHLESIEKSYVTNTMMVVYVNQLREANTLMRVALEGHEEFDKEEFARINARMDRLIREMVPHNIRGETPKL